MLDNIKHRYEFTLSAFLLFFFLLTASYSANALDADGFDYPFGNKGVDGNAKIRLSDGSDNNLNKFNQQYFYFENIGENNQRFWSNGGGGEWYNYGDVGHFNAGWSGLHPGEDWNLGAEGVDAGEPVYAIANGIVVDIKSSHSNNGIPNIQSGAWTIIIRHSIPRDRVLKKFSDSDSNREEFIIGDDRVIYSIYMHVTGDEDGTVSDNINEFPVRIGENVLKGDRIGDIALGTLRPPRVAPFDSMTTLPSHLHFEIRNGSIFVISNGDDIYPHSTRPGSGYYTDTLGIPRNAMNVQQVTTAFGIMHNDDGILDPSDFIAANRDLPVREPCFDAGTGAVGDAIRNLCRNNIVSGYPDGTVKPNGNINRAEMAKILAQYSEDETEENGRIKDYTCAGVSPFSDIPIGEWYCVFVNELRSKNIVEGYLNNGEGCNGLGVRPYFCPENQVTHDETAKFVLNTVLDVNLPRTEWPINYRRCADSLNLFLSNLNVNNSVGGTYINRGDAFYALNRAIEYRNGHGNNLPADCR